VVESSAAAWRDRFLLRFLEGFFETLRTVASPLFFLHSRMTVDKSASRLAACSARIFMGVVEFRAIRVKAVAS
jgi:hypothetical protein